MSLLHQEAKGSEHLVLKKVAPFPIKGATFL